jgi:SAM-dependent methyltransferase
LKDDPLSNLPPAPPEFYSRAYFLGRCGGYAEFAEAGGRVADPIRARALRMMAPRPEQHVLDLGCGRGELCAAAAEAGATVIGIDFSRDALAMARETARRLGTTILLVRARAEALPLRDGALDTVLATDIVEHLPEPDLRRSVAEVHRSLRIGGRFIVHTAPTRRFLAVGQHLKRVLQRLAGRPVAPVLTYDSELREAGHSNLHSRTTLGAALRSAFADVHLTYAFSYERRLTRRIAASLGLAVLFGFNLWAVAVRRGSEAT